MTKLQGFKDVWEMMLKLSSEVMHAHIYAIITVVMSTHPQCTSKIWLEFISPIPGLMTTRDLWTFMDINFKRTCSGCPVRID